MRVVGFAGTLQRTEVAGDAAEERALPIHDVIVCAVCVVEDRELLPVAVVKLIQEQVSILGIRLGGDIIFDDLGIWDGDHIVKAKQTKATIRELHKMLAGLQIDVIGLWRFHRDKVAKPADGEHDTDIGAALVLIEGNAVVAGMKEVDVRFFDVADKQILQNSTFPAKKKRGCSARPAFQLPVFFKSLLNGKGFPLF